MRHAIPDRQLRISNPIRSVHWLQKEVPKAQPLKLRRHRASLRKHQLQFIARRLHKPCSSLRTHANPVNPRRRLYRTVRFHRNLKIALVQFVDQHAIQLQQRLASRAHYKSPFLRSTHGPCRCNRLDEIAGGLKSALHPRRLHRQIVYRRTGRSPMHDRSRDPTINCILQTGRTPPLVPTAHLRLAAYKKSL